MEQIGLKFRTKIHKKFEAISNFSVNPISPKLESLGYLSAKISLY